MRIQNLFRNPVVVTVAVLIAAAILGLIIMQFTEPPEFNDDVTVTVRLDQAKVRADVATSPGRLEKGLMGAEPLMKDRALLFAYEEPTTPTIWMKGVEFPIDIVWISGDTVTQVTSNVPSAKPGVPDAQLPKYQPEGPVDKVLETSAGWARQHSVQPGDVVRFSR
ncbi:MAG TPA: DUF192 domain-containing protein [Patescibacteria group bacterium]|jgi:hypothetical protein